MNNSKESDATTIQDSLEALRIEGDTIPAPVKVDIPPDEPNPWQDSSSPELETSIKIKRLDGLSTNTLDMHAQAFGLGNGSGAIVLNPNPNHVDVDADLNGGVEGERRKKELLEEFDPLVMKEEKAAREAWESTETYSVPLPPPISPPTISSQTGTGEEEGVLPGTSVSEATLAEERPPIPPAKDIDEDKDPVDGTTTEPTTTTTLEGELPPALPPRPPTPPRAAFPALAALAKTFSLPLGNRTRPRSLDLATSVPSPATLSSFASQQQLPPLSSKSGITSPDRVLTPGPPLNGPGGDAGGSGGAGTSTPGRGSRPSSRGGGQDRVDVPPPFDFQKFLDQMKLKGADPVAKYLRSYVSVFVDKGYLC